MLEELYIDSSRMNAKAKHDGILSQALRKLDISQKKNELKI